MTALERPVVPIQHLLRRHKTIRYRHSLLLCSAEEKNSYRFKMTWWLVNDEKISIFGWSIPSDHYLWKGPTTFSDDQNYRNSEQRFVFLAHIYAIKTWMSVFHISSLWQFLTTDIVLWGRYIDPVKLNLPFTRQFTLWRCQIQSHLEMNGLSL